MDRLTDNYVDCLRCIRSKLRALYNCISSYCWGPNFILWTTVVQDQEVTSMGRVKKPSVIEDKIEIREILHATILFDHDIIDGALQRDFWLS